MKHSINVLVIICGAVLGVTLVIYLGAEMLWFREVGYLSSFLGRLLAVFVLFSLFSAFSALFLLGNLYLAEGFKWHSIPKTETVKFKTATSKNLYLQSNPLIPQSIPIRFPWLLLIVVGMYVLIGFTLLYYGELVRVAWKPDVDIPNVTPALPSPLEIAWLQSIFGYITKEVWKLGIVAVTIALLLIKPKFALRAIAIIISLLFGVIFAGNWADFLKLSHFTLFHKLDPQFGKDISFYVFKLPVWQLIYFWLSGIFLYSLLSVSLTYFLSANSLSEGKFPGFSRPQLRHLYALWGGSMAVLMLRHILNRYELLFSSRGVVYGAGYTDVYIGQYIEIILGVIAALSSIWLLIKAITGASRQSLEIYRIKHKNFLSIILYVCHKMPFYLWFICLYLITLAFGYMASNMIQLTWVLPNELAKEKPYIERSIAYTRSAFNLDKIDAKTFDPDEKLTLEKLKENYLTIENVRLWDTRPLLQTNRQLQQIRLYYKFPDATIDRYLMKVESRNWNLSSKKDEQKLTANQLKIEKQQVILSARELDYEAVPSQAKTWVNKHLVYTHGYGFTLSPVNLVAQGGLPYYFVKDIGTTKDKGALRTSSELIQYSIPIGKPRIYYGQLTNTYVMTSTKVKELDFPSGEENVYTIYDGTGGMKIGSWWRRVLFSLYLKDWQMLFSTDFAPETKLLLRRNINQRLQAIAPFLQFDRDPYLVVVDAGNTPGQKPKNTLYWMVDAYTISDRYPYSDPGKSKFNYIRNSVKVVIDAYNGDVSFYIADAEDPIIQTWNKIFPEMFKPLEAMPASLHRHIRYPEDYFRVQSERLLTYHMTDPQVFYNREDQWQIPQEIYGKDVKQVDPYYLIMKLPDAVQEEFILLHPYTPVSRPNLIGWLAARSDGSDYGKLLLYQFPKQRLVYGPNQIEALINQDPQISQQISLWNREGSKVIQGNLLVIPIEESLLYVEPLYLEADRNSVPTLVRVIVFYENRIVMTETLQEALEAIFAPGKSPKDALVRPIEEL